MVEYRCTSRARRKALLQISKDWEGWQKRTGVVWLFALMAVAIIAGSVSRVEQGDLATGEIVLHMVCACFISVFPVMIAVRIRRSALYAGSSPYAEQVNGRIRIDGDQLQYTFWNLPEGDRSARKAIQISPPDRYKVHYEINRENIKCIDTSVYPFIRVEGTGLLTQGAVIEGERCDSAAIAEEIESYQILNVFPGKTVKHIRQWAQNS